MDSVPSITQENSDAPARGTHIAPARPSAPPARSGKQKSGSGSRIATFIIMVLIVLAAAGLNLNMSDNLKSAQNEIVALQERIDLQKQEKADLQKTLSMMKRQIGFARPSQEFILNFIKKRNPRVPTIVAMEVAKNILIYSKKNFIPPSLAVGVMEIESSYNPMAISSKDARGLMQVLYSAWSEKIDSKYELYEIDQNIRVGTEILNELLERHPIDKTLYAYLGGVDGEYLKKILKVAMTFEIERVREEQSKKTQLEASVRQTGKSPVAGRVR